MIPEMTVSDMARLERAKLRPPLYVAGPMTSSGNPYQNVRDGIIAGQRALDLGWLPFVPHTSSLSAMVTGRTSWEEALEYDYGWILRCRALLLLPGVSLGAEAEMRLSNFLDIPIFHGLDTLPTAAAFLDGTWWVQ